MTGGRFYCLGIVALDQIFMVDMLPSHDEKTFIQEMRQTAGGPPYNVAAALNGWNEDVALVAAIGDDDRGREVLSLLEKKHLTTSCLEIVPDMITAFTLIILDGTGEKALLIKPLEREILARIGQNLSLKQGDRVITHFYHDEVVLQLLAQAREVGGWCAIDLELPEVERWGWACAFDCAAKADFVVTNKQLLAGWLIHEGLNLSWEEGGKCLARALAKNGAKVCVTLGASGLIACDGEEIMMLPALPVVVQNTTGGGDVFLAAIAKALCGGRSFQDSLLLAATAAGLFVAGSFPDWDRIGNEMHAIKGGNKS